VEKIPVWQDTYTVRSYEVDKMHVVQFPNLCHYLQETAWHHAQNLEFGYFDLEKKGQMWVLARLVIEMDRFPRWDDSIAVQTWPKGTERLFALRDYLLTDAEGNRLGAAASFWLLLDSTTKKPLRLTEFRHDVPLSQDKHGLNESYSKIPPIGPEELGTPTIRKVCFSDLDQNNHVNYVRYIRGIIDTYSPEFHSGHTIRRFEINYMAEAVYGESMEIYSADYPDYRLHSVTKGGAGEELCRAKIYWN
jgi:medium-chain acyl-[acyl-carrier-protein] hydrolase